MGRPLPRLSIWTQHLLLTLMRIRGQMQPGTVSLRYPRLDLHVHKNPRRLYREIFLQECYLPLAPLGATPRILDIGANIGLASLYFLSRWPSARLEAWEPNPAAYDLLTRNVVTDRYPSAEIAVEPLALSTADGTAEFTVPSKDPTAIYARIPVDGAKVDETSERVRVRSRDARRLFAEPADLLKLDIEGHEYAVLAHALPESSRISSLAIEFHRVERNLEDLIHLAGRLRDEGGYWMSDRTGRPLVPESLATRKGSLLLRFSRTES